MTIVQKSQNVSDIEALLADLPREHEAGALMLPTHLRRSQIGGTASLIQFIITWAKRNPRGCLITHIDQLADAELELAHLADEDHGLIAIMMADDILLKSGGHSLKKLAYSAAKHRIERMDAGVAVARQGGELLFVCADHSTRAYLSVLYYQLEEQTKPVKSSRDFAVFSKKCLNTILPPNLVSSLTSASCNRLGLILHELFQNTDEWAKTDWKGQRIPRSMRGIRFEVTNRQQISFIDSVRGSPPLEAYVSHDIGCHNTGRKTMLEVSVFDSGPGLAQRWLRRQISLSEPIDEEYAATLACLRRHATSSLTTHRGLGLHRVMETLTEANGFLRLRSGRLSLFRDFVVEPYTPSTDQGAYLFDWVTAAKNKPISCAPVEGTLVTFLMPL